MVRKMIRLPFQIWRLMFKGVNSLLNFQTAQNEDRFGCHDGIRPSGEIDVGGRCFLGLEVGWYINYISCSERGQCKKTVCFRWHLDIYVTNISFDFTTCIKFTDIFAYCDHIVWYITISGRRCSYFQSWRVSLPTPRPGSPKKRGQVMFF